MERGLRVITLQGAIERSPKLLSQYVKNEWLVGNKIISHFGGSNNIFPGIIHILFRNIWYNFDESWNVLSFLFFSLSLFHWRKIKKIKDGYISLLLPIKLSSNYCDSNSCRSYSLLKAKAKRKGKLTALSRS